MSARTPAVSVENVNSTVKALRTLDRYAVRDFNRVIRAGLTKTLSAARAAAPTRTGEMRRRMKIKKNRSTTTSTGWSLVSDSTQGQILEFAAHGRTPRTQRMVSHLDDKYGAPGRFVWAAWDEQRTQFNADVAAAVAAAAAQVQAAVNTARG